MSIKTNLELPCWLGIDLHKDFLQLALIDRKENLEVFSFSGSFNHLDKLLARLEVSAIAIDSPSQPSKGYTKNPELRVRLGLKPGQWQDLRICEYLLGLGGYYWTRSRKAICPEWMQVGFALYKFLQKRGYILASSQQKGNLIEVFPGYAYKFLSCPQKLGKKTSGLGKKQREQILKRFIKIPLIPLSPHSLDAILSSLIARFYQTGEYPCYWLGEAEEGQILFPGRILPPKAEHLPEDLKQRWVVWVKG